MEQSLNVTKLQYFMFHECDQKMYFYIYFIIHYDTLRHCILCDINHNISEKHV